MKRIVATEKLQELNLQSQSEFFGAAEISRWEWYPHCSLFGSETHMCRFQDIQLLSGGLREIGSADHESSQILLVCRLLRLSNEPIEEACYELGSSERQLEAIQRKG